jgi:dipeptidyl aminopeptidase/acylaminoacyl peptidase
MGALGDSAGGYLAVVLGTRDLDADIAHSGHVQCVVDFYGPTDLTVMAPTTPLTDPQKYALQVMRDLLGATREQNPALYRAASPLFDVSARSAPTLIIQGMDDPLVPPEQSERLADALHAAGVETVLALMYKQGHGFLRPGEPGTYGGMSVEWLTHHLKP